MNLSDLSIIKRNMCVETQSVYVHVLASSASTMFSVNSNVLQCISKCMLGKFWKKQ